MAFPTTLVLDDFNRGDEGPPPSSAWEAANPSFPTDGIVVATNEAAAETAATDCMAMWIAPFGPHVEVFVDIPVRGPSDGTVYVVAAQNIVADFDGYTAALFGSAAIGNNGEGDRLSLRRWDNGSTTEIGRGLLTWSNGDAVGLRRRNDQVEGWYKPSGGVWQQRATAIDATYHPPLTQLGVLIPDTDTAGVTRLDNFGGGVSTPEAADLIWFPPGGDIAE